MTFFITKLILSLLLPPASLLILILSGFLIAGFCRLFGRLLIGVGVITLYLLSISPVSDALLRPLEAYAPPLKTEKISADAVVVLGGGVTDLSWIRQPSEPSGTAAARLIKGISLQRLLRRPLVLVGGNGDPFRKKETDADTMARLARGLGVPARDIILENRSRNTLEGARALRSVIRGKRIVLVTSAYHMKRASGMFRKQGFEVTPAPAAYLSEQLPVAAYSFIPAARYLDQSSAACSEYLSLAWYTLVREL